MTAREIVERYYDEVWAQRSPKRIPEFFSETYRNHAGARGTLAGPAGILANYDSLISTFPDVRFTLDDVVVEEPKVVVRYTMYGTHQGLFQGIAATGKEVIVPGIGIYLVRNNKIDESWVLRDSLVLLRQLGAVT